MFSHKCQRVIYLDLFEEDNEKDKKKLQFDTVDELFENPEVKKKLAELVNSAKEAVRTEEKEKLYPQIKKLKDDNQVLMDEKAVRDAEIEKEKQKTVEAERARMTTEQRAAADLENIKLESAKALETATNTLRSIQEERHKDKMEALREKAVLKAKLPERLAKYVTGESEEDIQKQISDLQETFKDIISSEAETEEEEKQRRLREQQKQFPDATSGLQFGGKDKSGKTIGEAVETITSIKSPDDYAKKRDELLDLASEANKELQKTVQAP